MTYATTVAIPPPANLVGIFSSLHPRHATPDASTRCSDSMERPLRGSGHPTFMAEAGPATLKSPT
eukprot:15485302-Alexandrium_andersonii.AAC.1